MSDRGPGPTMERYAAASAVAAAIITVASIPVFRFLYRDCSELGCLAILLFIPTAAIGSAIAAIVVGAKARRGPGGYVVTMIAAAVGFVVALLLARAVNLLGA
ncbi:MAG TPA: hypothetical protein VFR14_03205 [Candidatus Limnocylindrales bacterium]|nr:hypothetical protein [Candidatus Limnocylindrales bacterium]